MITNIDFEWTENRKSKLTNTNTEMWPAFKSKLFKIFVWEITIEIFSFNSFIHMRFTACYSQTLLACQLENYKLSDLVWASIKLNVFINVIEWTCPTYEFRVHLIKSQDYWPNLWLEPLILSFQINEFVAIRKSNTENKITHRTTVAISS